MTRHTTLDQQQTALKIYANHFEILHRGIGRTEVASHALTRENTPRILRHTDGARNIMATGVAVGSTTGSEVVTLDGAGIALTNRNPTYINLLTDGKDIDTNHITSLQGGETICINAKFLEHMTRLDTRLGEMTGSSLINTTGTPNTERHLNGGITVRFSRFDLGHTVIGHIQHSYRNGLTILSKNASHAHLAPDKA